MVCCIGVIYSKRYNCFEVFPVKREIRVIVAGLLILSLSSLAFAQKRVTRLTIFPNNQGLVEEERTIVLRRGVNEITFGKVSNKIILDSVQVKAEGCQFLEQEYSSDFLLSWKVQSEREGEVQLRMLYLTGGLSWDLSYRLEIDKEATSMNIYGWARVENKTEMNFFEAYLTLVTRLPISVDESSVSSENLLKSSLTTWSSILDIPYALSYPVTLRTGEEKRFLLFSEENVPVKKVYLFDGSKYGEEVREELWFVNMVEGGLGIPLPEGRVYIYQNGSGERVIFLGEVHLPEVSLQEIGKIYLGPAKNLKGERILVYMKPTESYQDEQGYKVTQNEYSYKIILHNYRQLPTTIEVVEHYYGELESLVSYPLADELRGNLIFYRVELASQEKKEIEYTARTRSVSFAANTTN